MKIESFSIDDIAPFIKLATDEGWIVDPWEFNFLLSEFHQGCFTARSEYGETIGFITSIKHDRSGWIGNLIVSSDYRGKGIGGLLFKKSMESLLDIGVETLWLTASKSGMPLYQKLGFKQIDSIVRWRGVGRQKECIDDFEATDMADMAIDLKLNEIDTQVWGDRREKLLAATAGRGKVFRGESAFIVAQQGSNIRQLGPFVAYGYKSADALLKAALNSVPLETEICIDAPVSNHTAFKLFTRNRMKISGSNGLMYFGVKPAYRPELLYGLATMGSSG